MIGYATIGTNDVEKAGAFYDALLGEVGGKRLMPLPNGILYASDMGQPMIGVCTPFDGKPATVGNGTMIALAADSRADVDRIHAKALELGGKDEGAVGPRGEGNFYGGYFRDLDGNKLCCFCMKAEG